MNVICYKRVSTDDQADRGFSLQHQEKMLTQYCEINNHNLVGMYTEDCSGKSFDRPEWKKIISYIKKNKGKVDVILCLRWDRFSRNHYDALTTIKELFKVNVIVNCVEQPLDLTNPDNKVLLSLYLTIPEVENDKNSIRTTEGSRRARIEGCWTGTAPRGYLNYRDDKKSTLRASPDAPLIVQAFEKMASGGYSAEEVRRWINGQGIKLSKQSFLNIIRNMAYMGKIYIKPWKKEPSQIVMGLHPALISESIFYKANEVLDGKKRNMIFHLDKTDLYPLKGFLKCPVHNVSLTAYGARSRTNKIHHYYLCTQCKGSNQRHRITEAHEAIEEVLSNISITATTLTLYKKILEKLFEKEDYIRKDEMQKVKNQLENLLVRKSNLQDMLLDGKISSKDFNEMKQKTEKDIALNNNKLEGLKQHLTPYKNYINNTVPMLENLVSYYRKSNGKTKKKILGCIFSEKLVLEKGKVATTPFTTPILVLLNATKVLGRSTKKKEIENDLLSCWAPPAGLEPATL